MYWFLIAIQLLLIGWTLGGRWCTSALLQKLLIGLKILHRWNWCAGRCWCTVVIWIKYFGDKHTNPSWWRQTTAIQIMATWLQAPCYFDSLREIAFVWNLNHISPGALIILCKHRRCIFYFCGARGWWTFVPAKWFISIYNSIEKNCLFFNSFIYRGAFNSSRRSAIWWDGAIPSPWRARYNVQKTPPPSQNFLGFRISSSSAGVLLAFLIFRPTRFPILNEKLFKIQVEFHITKKQKKTNYLPIIINNLDWIIENLCNFG